MVPPVSRCPLQVYDHSLGQQDALRKVLLAIANSLDRQQSARSLAHVPNKFPWEPKTGRGSWAEFWIYQRLISTIEKRGLGMSSTRFLFLEPRNRQYVFGSSLASSIIRAGATPTARCRTTRRESCLSFGRVLRFRTPPKSARSYDAAKRFPHYLTLMICFTGYWTSCRWNCIVKVYRPRDNEHLQKLNLRSRRRRNPDFSLLHSALRQFFFTSFLLQLTGVPPDPVS